MENVDPLTVTVGFTRLEKATRPKKYSLNKDYLAEREVHRKDPHHSMIEGQATRTRVISDHSLKNGKFKSPLLATGYKYHERQPKPEEKFEPYRKEDTNGGTHL